MGRKGRARTRMEGTAGTNARGRKKEKECERGPGKGKGRRAAALCLSLLLGIQPAVSAAGAQDGKEASEVLTLAQARALAYAGDETYQSIKGKISTAQAKYTEAVRSAAMKKKDKMSFRWSPLLNFKFPEQPDLAEAYEWQYKPMQIQTELSGLRRELENRRCESETETALLYTEAYVSQEKIRFTQEQLAEKSEALEKSRKRAKAGEGSAAEVQKMEKSQEKLQSTLALLERSQESQREKLGELTGVTLRQDVRLENPMVTGRLERSMLEELTAYTLEHDTALYEAELAAGAGRIGLELNEKLMKDQYGGKLSYIQTYINQAKQGETPDQEAFKASYDAMLEAIDEPWQGSYRILFIKIPKEWFKGELSGVRYVEDEPYALYTSAMEYVELQKEEEAVRKELKDGVADGYEAVVTAANAYDALKKSVDTMEEELHQAGLKRRLGELADEELQTMQEEYDTYQMDLLDALADYSSQLYEFNRLTCGGAEKLLRGETLSEGDAGGAEQMGEDGNEPSYYIRSAVEDQMFALGVRLPEESGITATGFELWVDGTQIGARTPVGEELRHLTLAVENTEHTVIRLYREEEYLDECEIDPTATQGTLTFEALRADASGEEEAKKEARTVASYVLEENEKLGTATLSILPMDGEAAYYRPENGDGVPLLDGKLIPIDESFTYLSLLAEDFSEVRIAFYGENRVMLYLGRPDTQSRSIRTEENGT